MERKEEEKLLLSKITDKINFCERKNKIQVTDFLDLSQKQQVYIFLNTKKIKTDAIHPTIGFMLSPISLKLPA